MSWCCAVGHRTYCLSQTHNSFFRQTKCSIKKPSPQISKNQYFTTNVKDFWFLYSFTVSYFDLCLTYWHCSVFGSSGIWSDIFLSHRLHRFWLFYRPPIFNSQIDFPCGHSNNATDVGSPTSWLDLHKRWISPKWDVTANAVSNAIAIAPAT